jgi:hypothetical protein
MNNIEIILQNEIRDALTKRPISFVVMNKKSHDLLIQAINNIWTNTIDKITKYQGLDVLLSEDVNDNQFRIG